MTSIAPIDGETLKRWMDRHGYSVRGLARALGVAPSTITRWREGKRAIPRYVPLALIPLQRTPIPPQSKE